MSITKRLRVMWAALSQEWHENTCAECGGTWLAVGPKTDLIAICDHCEINQMEKFAHDMNQRYEEEMGIR